MNFLAYGLQPGGPWHKLCPSEEPNEAMADRGRDGRTVRAPSKAWERGKGHDVTGNLLLGPGGCNPAQQRLATSWKRVLRGVSGNRHCEA